MRRTYITALTAAIVLGPLMAFAWVSAPSSPPNNNIDQPLNVGSVAQSKVAGLLLSTNSGNTNGLIVQYGNVGIGATSPSYKLQVGGSGDGSAVGSNAFFYMSDARLKTNISTASDALAKILQLRGVSFNWKSTGKADVGLVAQEVEKVYPELVSTGADGIKAVEYGHLVGPLVEAIKAQQAEIDALKAEITALRSAN